LCQKSLKNLNNNIMIHILISIFLAFILFSHSIFAQGVSIGENPSSPHNSAILDLQSTNSGFLITRMTTQQRDAISNPAEALMIFNTTTKCLEIFLQSWKSIWCETDTGFTCPSNVTDVDGYIYAVVQIGQQCWMAENMRYLPTVTDETTGSQTNPLYYVYGYNGTDVNTAITHINYLTYGALYNWSAAISVCPIGWQLPSDDDWKEMEMYLGMSQAIADNIDWRQTNNEGDKLKTIGTTLWIAPNNGNNSTGFSALPSGYRASMGGGSFMDIGTETVFWTSSVPANADYAWTRFLRNNTGSIGRFSNFILKQNGFAVRCIKN
jgi:uncharacterized protein (TIGR02145 family)